MAPGTGLLMPKGKPAPKKALTKKPEVFEDTHSPINPRQWVGKTIARMDARAVNVVRFFFTDGTALAIETEGMGHGIVGMVQCGACIDPTQCEVDSCCDECRQGFPCECGEAL